MYTLAGLSNRDTGWGIAGDTFSALAGLRIYGEDAWFGLGDRDLATHLRRTTMLDRGHSLSDVTTSLCRALDVKHPIVPMTDDRVRTRVETEIGELAFQEYFVKHRCEPVVKRVRFEGADSATPSEGFAVDLEASGVLIFCPSNPFLSVAPILALPGVRSAIEDFDGPRIAVSPIVGGQALRGPAAKMLAELGHGRFVTGSRQRLSRFVRRFRS